MRDAAFAQLGFDFDDTSSVAAGPSPLPLLSLVGPETNAAPVTDTPRDKPSRGRAATRARTAVLFSRLQDLGLHSVESLVLMRTRTVMVSLIGRTLRVNEGYADAPEHILRAIVDVCHRPQQAGARHGP